MAEEEDMPPFWLQPAARRHGHRRSQLSSMFLNSGLLLIILLVIAFIFVFYIVPSFLSFTSQVLKPHSIKKGWDSLNLVLVLFAIVCGFLARNNNNSYDNHNNSNNKINNHEGTSYYGDHHITNVQQDAQRSYPSTPHRWYDQYHERTARVSLSRLRSFSSYPDLRLESSWLTHDERWRFHDDTHLNSYRSSSSDQLHHDDDHRQEQIQEPKKEEDSKDNGVDISVEQEKEVVYTPPPPRQPPSPPSPPPPPPSLPPPPPSKTVRRKVKRTYNSLGHEKRSEEVKDLDVKNSFVPPPSPPPPPPPPPPPLFSKSEKRRGKDFLTNLRRRKKKQRQKSVENLESLFNPEPSFTSFIPPPSPPPPPPPPPPHFLQNLFSSKKGKTKKVLFVPPPPPPPPPPPISSTSLKRVSKLVAKNLTPPLQSGEPRTEATQVATVTSHNDKPPKQVKTSRLNRVEEKVDSGNASPLIPIPPPPPPPPFRMQPWRFLLDGDYVRVASFNSSRSGSPDLESLEDPSDKELSSPMAGATEGGGGGGGRGEIVTMPLFCPSPDVNTKADNFIARFRAGLKMEKVNSVKGRSNLGPELISGPEEDGPS